MRNPPEDDDEEQIKPQDVAAIEAPPYDENRQNLENYDRGRF